MSKYTSAAVITIAMALAAGCASRPVHHEIQPEKAEKSKGGEAAGAVAKGAGKGLLVGGAGCLMPVGVGAKAGPIGFIVGGAMTVVCMPYGLVGGAIVGGAVGAARHHASQNPSATTDPQSSAATPAVPATETRPACSVVQRDGQVLQGRFGQPISGRFDSDCAAANPA